MVVVLERGEFPEGAATNRTGVVLLVSLCIVILQGHVICITKAFVLRTFSTA